MVVTYNLKEFGKRIKQIRTSLNLTQEEVANLTRISRDTLIKLEKGNTYPKLDTLFLLSNTYKIDIIDVLKSYSNSQLLLTYYKKIDYILSTDDKNLLKKYLEEFREYKKEIQHEIVDYKLLHQFELFLDGATIFFNSEDNNKFNNSLSLLISALKITNTSFNLTNFSNLTYNYFELRILYLIASIHGFKYEIEISNQILGFIFFALDKSFNADLNEKHLITKIYSQLSHNYYRDDKFIESLQWANKGITYCIKHYLLTNLYFLYARKGAAMFYLKQNDYMRYFNYSVSLLELSKDYELADTFKKIITERYS